MDYRRFGDACYVRMDRDDEMIGCILDVCRKEGISSATYSGIGGCKAAEISTFDPVRGAFQTELLEGMLELVSFMGNVISDESGTLFHHTHALYAFERDGAHQMRGGHLKSSTVLYTAEIELRPVQGGSIGRRPDPETGTGFWSFDTVRA